MPNLLTDLFPHQVFARDKLAAYPNVAFFDDMGTGKTVAALDIDRIRRKQNWPNAKTLVVTLNGPVMDSWRRHFEDWTDLKVCVLNPKKRAQCWADFIHSNADVFVVHWDGVRVFPELQDITWLHVIGDEVHKIMHRDTKTTKEFKRIRTGYKTGLTGTPTSGRPDLLWSILNWLYPKVWRSYHKFFEEYVEYSYSNEEVDPDTGEVELNMFKPSYKVVKGPKNEEKLQALIEPYTVRRLLREVRPGMPDRLPPQVLRVELSPTQRKMYNQMRDDMLAWVSDRAEQHDEISPIVAPIVIVKLMRLVQFACATAWVDLNGDVQLTDPSAKLDLIMSLIEANPTTQLVIFSNFKKLVYLLNTRLQKANIPFSTVHGDIKSELRDDEVQRFQSGKSLIFTGTTQAGGTGIDLFAANRMIHIDRNYSAIVNQQAEGRIDRIGQTQPIQIIDIVAENTIEDSRLEDVKMKWSWVKQLLGK